MKQKIGIVTISYNQKGQVSGAIFDPARVDFNDDTFLLNLLSTEGRSQEEIKKSADKILAAWFNKVDNIELEDREKFRITSQIVSCDKWKDDTVKSCVIEYSLEEVTNAVL